MLQMRRWRIYLILVLVFTSTHACAETVILKSGKILEGRISERADKYIKIDFQGTMITYFLDEIKTIDGKDIEVSAEENINNDANIDKNKIIEEVLELSGAKKQVSMLPDLIDSQLEQYKNEEKPEVFETISKAMKESYKADTIYRIMANNLLANFDQDRFLKTLEWYHSPLAQKITQLEIAATTPETLREISQYAATLESNLPPETRINLIQRLDKAVGSTDLNIEIVSTVGLQMIQAVQMVTPEDKRIKEENWEDKFKSQIKSRMQEHLKQEALISYLYIYRSLPDDELEQYVSFFESENGRWLMKIMSDGYLDAMAKIGREIGNNLGDHLKIKDIPQPTTGEQYGN